MKNLSKALGAAALTALVVWVLMPMAGGAFSPVPGADSTVGSCSTVGGQSTVGGESNVCGAPTTPVISNLPANGAVGGSFTAIVSTNGDGTKFVTSGSASCTVGTNNLTVTYTAAGTCLLTAHVSAGTTYGAADGNPQSIPVSPGTPSPPSVTNVPTGALVGGSFTAAVNTTGDGTKSVSSSTGTVCTVGGNGLTVAFAGAGACTLTAHVAAGTNYSAGTGASQTFAVAKVTTTAPRITNIPSSASAGGSFVAQVSTSSNGATSVASETGSVCTVGADGHTVSEVSSGTCTLVASVAATAVDHAASGSAQSFTVNPVTSAGTTTPTTTHGYWLVGSDGGIFSFGSAAFHGSMGGTSLQRPVVGIVPTGDRGGYWLVGSDGGAFSFGDTQYLGSIPALNLHPAGSGQPNSLDAPIVGMVPSHDDKGYFMVASDGGVFAFGDAKFAGSCPGIGGCGGAAVAVMPDATGNGYWLITKTGSVYTFGDAPYLGAPGPQSSPITSATATPDGKGYWILDADGQVFNYGDAANLGSPPPTPRAGSTRQPRSSPLRTERATGSATRWARCSPSVTLRPRATCRAPTSTARSSQPAGPDPLPARLTGRGDGGGGRHGDDQQAPEEGRRPRRLPRGVDHGHGARVGNDDGERRRRRGRGRPPDRAGHRPRVGRAPAA